jgi:D-glycero-D-manno-heptose 1,7-bisphosphate phosphatase
MTPPKTAFHHYVLLDRDGVINVERGEYTLSREQWVWAPGAFEGLKLLKEEGFGVIVITNQSCIAKGLQTERRLAELHRYMRNSIKTAGGEITDIYSCPHQSSDRCSCRKPEPGLILKAASDYLLNLSETFFIGDSALDIEAARRAGTRSILIRNEWNARKGEDKEMIPVEPDFYAENLSEAARIVVVETVF